jgi:hypothetical protein
MGCDEFEDLVCGIIIVGEVEVDVKIVFALRIGRVHSSDVVVFDKRRIVVRSNRLKHHLALKVESCGRV